ncbi:MAG: hypothetical protein GMKNLPBB_00657 [Myxococcota bacterium]|nr:hypothetical protein [Myxococcota bacterium]
MEARALVIIAAAGAIVAVVLFALSWRGHEPPAPENTPVPPEAVSAAVSAEPAPPVEASPPRDIYQHMPSVEADPAIALANLEKIDRVAFTLDRGVLLYGEPLISPQGRTTPPLFRESLDALAAKLREDQAWEGKMLAQVREDFADRGLQRAIAVEMEGGEPARSLLELLREVSALRIGVYLTAMRSGDPPRRVLLPVHPAPEDAACALLRQSGPQVQWSLSGWDGRNFAKTMVAGAAFPRDAKQPVILLLTGTMKEAAPAAFSFAAARGRLPVHVDSAEGFPSLAEQRKQICPLLSSALQGPP